MNSKIVILFSIICVMKIECNDPKGNAYGKGNSNSNSNSNSNGNVNGFAKSTAADIKKFIEETFTDTNAQYDNLIFPRNSFGDTIKVDIGFQLAAITDFDEVAGTIELIGNLVITWYDQLADDAYDGNDHGHFEKVMIPNTYLWKPPVSLFNSASAIVPVGDTSNLIRMKRIYNQSDPMYEYSQMTWKPGVVTKTGCVVDISNFPFDRQTCNVTFTHWGFTDSEVKFEPSATTIDTTMYTESDEFTLLETRLLTEVIDGGSFVKMEITLERKPMYYLLNFFLPIIILGVLNALVFILPMESGERVGYSVTTFLTFAVYLTLISEGMPRTSEPMALLSYYLMSMVVVSSVAAIITIFTLRVYLKDEDDPVPIAIALFIACLKCLICKREDDEDELPLLSEEIELEKVRKSRKGSHANIEDNGSIYSEDETDPKYGVTWNMVGGTCDVFSFFAIAGGSIAIAVVFLVPLAAQM